MFGEELGSVEGGKIVQTSIPEIFCIDVEIEAQAVAGPFECCSAGGQTEKEAVRFEAVFVPGYR